MNRVFEGIGRKFEGVVRLGKESLLVTIIVAKCVTHLEQLNDAQRYREPCIYRMLQSS